MAIKLRVISDHYRELGENRSRVFGVNGGTVGRAPDNDWVLPDPRRVVSGHHFEVQFHSGKYWLIDTSTNGVFVNDADDPASDTGRVELRDGDRLRVGDYDILVSVDNRIDFLPASGEEQSAAKHLDSDIGHSLDLDSLFTPRETERERLAPGRQCVRRAPERRGAREPARDAAALRRIARRESRSTRRRTGPDRFRRAGACAPPMTAATPAAAAAATGQAGGTVAWQPGLGTAARARFRAKNSRTRWRDARPASTPASARSRFTSRPARGRTCGRPCRLSAAAPASIRPSLSPEAQAMLPLVAGQLLREAVVGLNDIVRARATGAVGAAVAALPVAPGSSSNPLRSSTSIEQALQRLFESHGRLFAGPVDSLRDVLQDMRDHETALAAGMRAGLDSVLGQLVAGQRRGPVRARPRPPARAGQDPRPRYWEHYSEFYRLLTQQTAGSDELPRSFTEAFEQRVRAHAWGPAAEAPDLTTDVNSRAFERHVHDQPHRPHQPTARSVARRARTARPPSCPTSAAASPRSNC